MYFTLHLSSFGISAPLANLCNFIGMSAAFLQSLSWKIIYFKVDFSVVLRWDIYELTNSMEVYIFPTNIL